MTQELSHEPRQITPSNFRPAMDYRRVLLAVADALYAIERGVLADFWPAYERMHEAAAMGPMDWTGRLTNLAFTCSGNSATLVTGDLALAPMTRSLHGLMRNLEANEPFTVWKSADDIFRGARRIHLYGLAAGIADLTQKIDRMRNDQSSEGLQSIASYRSALAADTARYAKELIACGLTSETAVA